MFESPPAVLGGGDRVTLFFEDPPKRLSNASVVLHEEDVLVRRFRLPVAFRLAVRRLSRIRWTQSQQTQSTRRSGDLYLKRHRVTLRNTGPLLIMGGPIRRMSPSSRQVVSNGLFAK